MPKGGKKKHKGQHRRFTAPEEIDKQLQGSESGSQEESSESENETKLSKEEKEKLKPCGVQHLIEVSNPNHQKERQKKLSQLNFDDGGGSQLSRRQREEIEAEKAKKEYERLHALGKTSEAQADLARLALIRREREEAARRREAEKEAKEAAKAAKLNELKAIQEKNSRAPNRGRHKRKQGKDLEKNIAGDDKVSSFSESSSK